ncbi:hypothetical protein ONS95_006807 [Cadophora gregata]|uniref:uncharacterized protein n=1 Tax=Cadophora gregata TaxID=51156 RepID=UPI0026DC737B|nr:uncharacterized protein ONS95_006807 [Cadophora gregata]KAK0101646.1 hypothetical protein ONS95_006807 [Cadophora gregata]
MALQTFLGFGNLPAEVRTIIWQKVAAIRGPRRITVVIRATNPTYVPYVAARETGSKAFRTLGGPYAYVSWTWTCYAAGGGYGPSGFVGMLGASRESRGEYQRLNPQSLRIENGPVIHFNAARDTIVMDARSLFSLHMYTIVPDHLLLTPTWPRNLRGFDTIQNLQTSLRHNDIAAFTPGSAFFANGILLAGVRHPITVWRPNPKVLMKFVNDCRPQGVWHRFNDYWHSMYTSPRAPRQNIVIDQYFGESVPGSGGPDLLAEVNKFFVEQ